MPERPQSCDQEGKRGDAETPSLPTLAKNLESTKLGISPLTMGRSNVKTDTTWKFAAKKGVWICLQTGQAEAHGA